MGVAAKINQVMNKVNYLQKDGKVEYGRTKYNYLSEEKITAELNEAFREVGLIIFPCKMEFIGEKEIPTKSGSSYVCQIIATYRIQDTDTDEYIEIQTLGEGMDSGDKAINKAMTAAFKYAQRQSFMIPTGDDPDHISSDELLEGKSNNKPTKPTKRTTKKSTYKPNNNGYTCTDCGKEISQAEDAYSKQHFNVPLCRGCQDIRRASQNVS